MCLLSVPSFVWFLSIFIPENLPPTRFSFLPVHLPPPPPPLPPPSSSTSASHQSLSFPSLRSPRPPSHELSTYTRQCARVLACMLTCWCVCVCVGVDASVCVCLSHTDAALQGSLLKAVSVTQKKRSKVFQNLWARVCVCVRIYVTYMDVLWTWLWSEMPQWHNDPHQ